MALFPEDRSFVQAALDAVGRAGMAPVDMRHFAARADAPADYCRQRVRECEVYVAVIGFRYGTMVPGEAVSYTELEFEEATVAGLPRLVFLLGGAPGVPAALADDDRRRAEGFRQRLRDARVLVREFSSAAGLELEVFHALRDLPEGGPGGGPPTMGLRRLLRDCLVQIDSVDGTRPAGSGFFVAPGYVLTCSHVVRRQAPNPVTGQWRGEPWSGRVIYASPPASPGADGDDDAVTIWPEPDLAIIRLDDTGARHFAHPCARLASREPEEGSRMIAFGRRLLFGSVPGDFPSATMEYTGKFLYLMRLRNERFGQGMSGGPVLDLTSGEVCGIAKLADGEQDGYAVPVRLAYDLPEEVVGDMLRAHDLYHDGNRAWVLAQQALWDARPADAAPLLRPDSEAELLALIARLPGTDPARLGQLYSDCARSVVHPDPGALRALRDVALQLSDLLHGRDKPHPVIILAELLAAKHPEFAAKLRDWSIAEAVRQDGLEPLRAWRASRLPAEWPAGTATDPMAVVIQLEPCAHARDRYVYTIWRYREAVVLVAQENEPLALSEIIARFTGELPVLLGQLPGEHVIVEFILPLELFDEPVHQWQVFRRAFVRLGYRYPVVIRDWERINDEENRRRAMIKWDRLSAQSSTPLQWLSCTDRRTDQELYPEFELKRGPWALGLPRPAAASTDAFTAALEAGVRVALWRLTSCRAHSGADATMTTRPCDGMLFQQAADEQVAPTPLHLLPSRVRELRLSPGALSDAALLWDNPHRGPHPRGLAVQ
jgi:hypothetical protein